MVCWAYFSVAGISVLSIYDFLVVGLTSGYPAEALDCEVGKTIVLLTQCLVSVAVILIGSDYAF